MGGVSVEAFPHNVIPLPALRIVGIQPVNNVLHNTNILIMKVRGNDFQLRKLEEKMGKREEAEAKEEEEESQEEEKS